MKLKGKLETIGVNEQAFFEDVENFCESNIISSQALRGFDYIEDEDKLPNWTLLNITANYDIFYGNAGAHTRKLGNIIEDEPRKLLELILRLLPNYGWSAYYDVGKLPPVQTLISAVSPLTSNYVYPKIQDCIYRWLDVCGFSGHVNTP